MGLLSKISRMFSSRNQQTSELVGVCDCEKLTGNKKLIQAAKLHHVNCLKRSLEEGAGVNARCISGKTPAIVAVIFGNDKGLEVLLKAGAFVNLRSWNGYTPLMEASKLGRTECVDLLLNADADINLCSDRDGLTALQLARNGGCIKLLLDAGADVNEPGPNGGTALNRAVCIGNVHRMKVLIEAGADVNSTVWHRGHTLLYGVTALHQSYRLKHVLGLKLLLLAGAKVNMFHSKGSNALTYYIESVAHTRDEHIMLLFAAGEKVQWRTCAQSYKVWKAVSDCGFLECHRKPRLMSKTRWVIRKHLLELDPHTNLFVRVPRLGLPAALKNYLLYDQTLDVGDDYDHTDDSDGDNLGDDGDDNNHADGSSHYDNTELKMAIVMMIIIVTSPWTLMVPTKLMVMVIITEMVIATIVIGITLVG